jgi:tripartite-type tricarboxylate transporter receptor subunit TctC
MLRFLATAILILAAAVPGSDAQAQQTYPTRTVRLILPFGAASATDITARLFADRLSTR